MKYSISDPTPKLGGHSALVEITLFVNGSSLPVAQLGPDYIFLRAPVNHPPTEAEILMEVDGDKERWRVFLPNGISAQEERVEIAVVT